MNTPKKMIFEDSVSSNHKENKLSYDDAFKRFFSRKAVLAVLLKEIIPDYHDLSISEIEELIISSRINQLNAETLAEEDVIFGSKIMYDVVIQCALPDTYTFSTMEANIIFDLEMQRKYQMPYSLYDRAIYYTSRLIAKQSVEHSSYDKLLPVYSTWICLCGIPEELQNTVHSFRLQDLGNTHIVLQRSLFNIDFLLLSEDYDWDTSDATIIKFLQAVFKNRMTDSAFNPFLQISPEIESEVESIMTAQEEYEYELQVEREQAAAEGREEGRAEGIAEGRAEGMAEGIISAAVRMHMTDIGVLTSMLVDELLITPKQAHEYIKKFLPDKSNDSEE